MHAEIPFFILALLIHISMYISSGKPDRRLRMMAGLAILFNTWPAWYGGEIMTLSDVSLTRWAGMALAAAPYYFPLLSFLVYLKSNHSWLGSSSRRNLS